MHIEPSTRTELATFDGYLRSLSSPIESYIEQHILDSQFYRITIDGAEAGAFALHDGALLTHFHLAGSARRRGQSAMARILADHPVSAALVPTCDEYFLSHAIDREHELGRQAYMFVEGNASDDLTTPDPPTTPAVVYRAAEPADAAAIRELSGDFLNQLDDRIAQGQIYVGHIEPAGSTVAELGGPDLGGPDLGGLDLGDLVTVGIAEPGRLLIGYASIGMYVHEAYRQRGIGTATIRYLRRLCHERGVTPIAGCWYYNHQSKMTLEAAGMVTMSRLLRIDFTGGTARES